MEDRFGRQPAHLAAMRNHSNVLEFLYEKGVELECPCDQGKLPLHYAAQYGGKWEWNHNINAPSSFNHFCTTVKSLI